MNRPGLLHFLFFKSILTIGISYSQYILICGQGKMVFFSNGFHFLIRGVGHRFPCLLPNVVEL